MIEIPLPSLGADMDSGKLLEWRVKPGDAIHKGSLIAIVDTEKAAIDVESWHDGIVYDLLAQPGDTLAVGTVMLRLIAPGEVVAPSVAATTVIHPAASESRVRASPAARELAREASIDLARVIGTGPRGAITLDDVAAAAKPARERVQPSLVSTEAKSDRHASVRAAIAVAMVRSHREIPHYYLWEQCDVTRALLWMQQSNAQLPVEERLVPAALFIAAIARAAREFKDMNGTYESGEYHPAELVNIGVAVALRGGGLIAPALRDTDKLSIQQIMAGLSDIVRRARAGGLRSSEVSGQTLTVTQLGDEGVDGVLGIIHPPQVALIGIGKPGERAIVESGRVVARTCVTISLAADHRVSDGRRGAQFLARIVALLQQPEAL
jgi:pyruvate dehydrogenase E2 component (dihydrolipoamide acetyltransferase)